MSALARGHSPSSSENQALASHARFVAIQAQVEQAEDENRLGAQMELRELWLMVHAVSGREAADALLAEIQAFSKAYADT